MSCCPLETDLIRSRGYQGDLKCLLCSHAYESLGHVLCHCSTARSILEAAGPFQSLYCGFTIFYINSKNGYRRELFLCRRVFEQLLMLLWALWRNRNEKLWSDKAKLPQELVAQTMAWFDDFVRVNQKPLVLSIKMRQTKWAVPLPGCLKFNVDGSLIS